MYVYVNPLHRNLEETKRECNTRYSFNKLDKNIVDIVTPWHQIDYEEQIRQKIIMCSKILRPIFPHTVKIERSPKTKYYLNHVCLSIGYSNNRFCIGIKGKSKNDNNIYQINDCIDIPEIAKTLSVRILNFILKTKNNINNKGDISSWENAIIRQNSKGMTMIAFIVNSHIDNNVILKLKTEFKDINSLYIIETFNSEKDDSFMKISGVDSIIEEINGVKFEIFPRTKFPTYLEAREILINKITDNIGKNTILIDINSGIGTYSFPLSNYCNKIFCLEKDPKIYYQSVSTKVLNNINNCEIINKSFEDVIDNILSKYKDKNITILLHSDITEDTLKLIMAIYQIKKVIIVTQRPSSLVDICQNVLMNQNEYYKSFYLDDCFGVDVFPNTTNVNIVGVFKRD